MISNRVALIPSEITRNNNIRAEAQSTKHAFTQVCPYMNADMPYEHKHQDALYHYFVKYLFFLVKLFKIFY